MAEKVINKTKDKKPNFFARFGKSISRFFREIKSEVKKIAWPNFPTVLKKTFVVLVVVVVIGIGIWIADFLLSQLIDLVNTLA